MYDQHQRSPLRPRSSDLCYNPNSHYLETTNESETLPWTHCSNGVYLFACAISIMKGVSAIPAPSGIDATYSATLSLLWATLEQAFVILLDNAAPLWPLTRLHIPLLSSLAESMDSLLGRASKNTSKATT